MLNEAKAPLWQISAFSKQGCCAAAVGSPAIEGVCHSQEGSLGVDLRGVQGVVADRGASHPAD